MLKKMFPDRKHAKIADILGYTFLRLHEGKKWYFDLRATDPETGELKRKKYYIPGQKSKREMRAQAAALIEKTYSQLRKGLTPWELNKSIRAATRIDDILGKYISSIENTSRKTTLESYSSRVNILREYIKDHPIQYTFQFDRTFVTDFLDWTVEHRGASPRTRNNYRSWCSSLADFMVERQYITENPVTAIRKLREPKSYLQGADLAAPEAAKTFHSAPRVNSVKTLHTVKLTLQNLANPMRRQHSRKPPAHITPPMDQEHTIHVCFIKIDFLR